MVTILALDGIAKKHFDHYALLKILSMALAGRSVEFVTQ